MDPVIGGALIGGAADFIGDLFGMSSAERANRTNIKLQREQQAWEKDMSNTAIQRRAADIEAAGGNRALAFVNGSEASTPSIAPARVEPVFRGGTNYTAKAMAAVQAMNLQAQTNLTNEQAKGQRIKNNIDNAFGLQVAALNLDLKETHKQITAKQYDLIEEQIRNTISQGELQREQTKLTGAQLAQQQSETKRFEGMTEAVTRLAIAQMKEGEINAAALQKMAETFGVEAEKATSLIGNIINAIKAAMWRATK